MKEETYKIMLDSNIYDEFLKDSITLRLFQQLIAQGKIKCFITQIQLDELMKAPEEKKKVMLKIISLAEHLTGYRFGFADQPGAKGFGQGVMYNGKDVELFKKVIGDGLIENYSNDASIAVAAARIEATLITKNTHDFRNAPNVINYEEFKEKLYELAK